MPTRTIFDDIVRYLRRENLHFGIGAGDALRLAIRGEHGEYAVLIHYPWEREIVVAYAEYSFRVPPEKRGEILEMAARINWGLFFGTCEYSPETGVVRFRSTMLTDDADFNAGQFGTMLSTAVADAERYAPAFDAVIAGRMTVPGALSAVEE